MCSRMEGLTRHEDQTLIQTRAHLQKFSPCFVSEKFSRHHSVTKLSSYGRISQVICLQETEQSGLMEKER